MYHARMITIMEQSPWDTDVAQRIICVLLLKFKKALLFFKSSLLFPPPHQIQCEFKLRKNILEVLVFKIVSGMGREVRLVSCYSRSACV